ncbi:MAG: DUF2232 domain-containing protein [Gammaproteobacteria bacterium]|jgi:hypothetical protein
MKALAAYMMRGRLQAILAAAGLAVLSLLLLPLSWPVSFLSGAAVGLVVLVQGPKEGILTTLGATAILAVLVTVFFRLPTMAGVYALMVWVPAWLLAITLLYGRSLAMAMNVGALLGICVVLGVYALIPNPAGLWYEHFTQQVVPLMERAGMAMDKAGDFDARLREASKVMTGTTVAFSVMAMWLALLIARNWQAVLYNPEGFRQEFRELRLGKPPAIIATLIAVLAVFSGGAVNELAMNALMVVLMLFMFQGLAVGHNLINQYQQGKAWIVGMYVVLVFTSPHGLVAFAMIGWLDNGFDFRKRFAKKSDNSAQDGD